MNRTGFSTGAATALALVLAGCETTPEADVSTPEAVSSSVANNAAEEAVESPELVEEAFEAEGSADDLGYPIELGSAGVFAAFEPAPSGSSRQVDYSVIDEALDLVVMNTGPSLRRAAPSRRPETGSRVIRGQTSRLRLEGNKIFFSQFDAQTREAVQEYADSLVAIGNQVDITNLPRNEQLAYWYNLHNMLIIATIAEEYPVPRPREIRINRIPLHDAKLVTIQGVPLSLSDIRRNIVYRYWSDPRVIYGFFHGDLSSPNIRSSAYRGDSVRTNLDTNAREFVNALRGVSEGRRVTYVSPHYYEARAGLFPNWPSDLRAHLQQYADEEVESILFDSKPFAALRYEDRTADLVGGQPYDRLSPSQSSLGGAGNFGVSPGFVEMAREFQFKFEVLRREGRLGTTVTIIDLPDSIDDVENAGQDDID